MCDGVGAGKPSVEVLKEGLREMVDVCDLLEDPVEMMAIIEAGRQAHPEAAQGQEQQKGGGHQASEGEGGMKAKYLYVETFALPRAHPWSPWCYGQGGRPSARA